VGGLRGRAAARPQQGQVVPLVAVVLVLAALLGVGLVRVAAASSTRAAAQAAADASALAGAADGEAAARRLAAANDARLTAFRVVADDVVVTVERAGVRAQARARWSPVPRWAGPTPCGPMAGRGGKMACPIP
jgi:hypothetical protein